MFYHLTKGLKGDSLSKSQNLNIIQEPVLWHAAAEQTGQNPFKQNKTNCHKHIFYT